MKKLIASLSMVASVCAFGAIDDTTICFSTKGPDTYADGTTVLDGERYALVRTFDAEKGFAGFNADGSLVNANDEILTIVSAAKNGRCPLHAYPLSKDEFLKGGVISLWMLDTRVTVAATETTPESVKFAELEDDQVAINSAKEAANVEVSTSASLSGAETTGAGILAAGADNASVEKIEVKEGKVYITLKDASGFVKYGVKAGTAPDALSDTAVAGQNAGDKLGEITVVIPQEKDATSGFFQIKK